MRSGHMRQESLKFPAPTVGCGLRPAAGVHHVLFSLSQPARQKKTGLEEKRRSNIVLKDLV